MSRSCAAVDAGASMLKRTGYMSSRGLLRCGEGGRARGAGGMSRDGGGTLTGRGRDTGGAFLQLLEFRSIGSAGGPEPKRKTKALTPRAAAAASTRRDRDLQPSPEPPARHDRDPAGRPVPLRVRRRRRRDRRHGLERHHARRPRLRRRSNRYDRLMRAQLIMRQVRTRTQLVIT